MKSREVQGRSGARGEGGRWYKRYVADEWKNTKPGAQGTELSMRRCLCISYVFLLPRRARRPCIRVYLKYQYSIFVSLDICAPDGHTTTKSEFAIRVSEWGRVPLRISLPPHLHHVEIQRRYHQLVFLRSYYTRYSSLIASPTFLEMKTDGRRISHVRIAVFARV